MEAVVEKATENGAESGEEDVDNIDGEDINNTEDRDYTYDEVQECLQTLYLSIVLVVDYPIVQHR